MSTGYGRPTPAPDLRPTATGPGTPAGELLRRYWQPVALSVNVGNLPVPARVLGEDLILFRDGAGRVGLVDQHCCHRGTSLYYGKVEADGIRCCYHGWLFDVEGRCVDQPCEPHDSTFAAKVRQPWYPCREYHGLVFAYLGPPESQPAFPRYDFIEDGEGMVVADGTSYGLGGGEVLDCNWLQLYENVMDPFHVMVLHNRFSGEQFTPAFALRPDVTWAFTDLGMCSTQDRRLDDGRLFRRVTEVLVPNIRIVSSVGAGGAREGFRRAGHIGWILPIDDTHSRMYSLLRVAVEDGRPVMPPRARHNGKLWAELTEAEHQVMPGDKEAVVSQRPIAVRALDRLGASDRGVIMLRQMLERELSALEAGRAVTLLSPEASAIVTTRAGNYIVNDA
ncbi:MAG: aromatic ring-hydroxylating dioxygenase subunit alpha [Vicinamibacterales bacterium]